ncbi:MAG TPA: HAMP domain-containing protein, partial [Burkholderiales bacterium]|nr:HAMP domain-containing protein [Burkholderiales bacterium]
MNDRTASERVGTAATVTPATPSQRRPIAARLLVPRTLLGRIALILAAALVVSQLVAFQLFRVYSNGPLLEEAAERAVSQIRTVGAAMQVLDAEAREEFLDLIESREQIHVLYDNANVLPSNMPEEDFLRAFAVKLRAALGHDTQFFVQASKGQALWVKLPVGAEQLWIGIPRKQIERPFPWIWLAWASVCALLAVASAYLLVRRVNRPLRDLASAAAVVGRGASASAVGVQGPEEIRNVAAAFNAMLADLKRIDAERALLLAGISHDLRTPL